MRTSADRYDPIAVLRLLTEHGIDFVVIGGIAAVAHGSPRITQDLDVTFDTSPSNLEALSAALTKLHPALAGAEEVPFDPHPDLLRRVEVLTLETDHGPLDLLASPAGGPGYRRLLANAERADIGGFLVPIASIPDLIAMKRAAGRPKDLADIAELEAIERLSRGTRDLS